MASLPEGRSGSIHFTSNLPILLFPEPFQQRRLLDLAFPDKEKAYSEVNRVLKPGGMLAGCFCIRGESRRTDWLMTRILSRKGWFTPPFETFGSLKARLERGYQLDEYHKEGSIVYFKATKR